MDPYNILEFVIGIINSTLIINYKFILKSSLKTLTLFVLT
jgi:hypothetical protein